jgi:hypothetical protein
VTRTLKALALSAALALSTLGGVAVTSSADAAVSCPTHIDVISTGNTSWNLRNTLWGTDGNTCTYAGQAWVFTSGQGSAPDPFWAGECVFQTADPDGRAVSGTYVPGAVRGHTIRDAGGSFCPGYGPHVPIL